MKKSISASVLIWRSGNFHCLYNFYSSAAAGIDSSETVPIVSNKYITDITGRVLYFLYILYIQCAFVVIRGVGCFDFCNQHQQLMKSYVCWFLIFLLVFKDASSGTKCAALFLLMDRSHMRIYIMFISCHIELATSSSLFMSSSSSKMWALVMLWMQ